LFVPGDDARKIAKAAQSNADAVILELEDGVALDRKDVARTGIVTALNTFDFGLRGKFIRVNAIQSPFFQDDMNKTLMAHPQAYVLPKVEHATDILHICQHIENAELKYGWAANDIGLIGIIETPLGVMNVKEIAETARHEPRLSALMFGAEDLAAALGAIRSKAGWEVFYARSTVVTASAAYGLHAIDQIYADFNDEVGLAEECVFARQLGYGGKIAIHPKQCEIINRAFSPSPEEIARAERLLAAFAEQTASGKGAFGFEGKMIDMPLIMQARRILSAR
jgi:citrate lyase beta subunit